MPAARREVSSGGVVYRVIDGVAQFLLIKAHGRWSFPKGNIEKGETPQVTAAREISEETGIPMPQLGLVQPLPRIEYAFQWQGRLVFKTVHNFLFRLAGEAPLIPQPGEVEEAAWFDAETARKRLSFKNSVKTLETAIAAVETLAR